VSIVAGADMRGHAFEDHEAGHHATISLDLVVLTQANARSVDQALAIYAGKPPVGPDDSGALKAYASEVCNAYDDDNWPFGGDPIVDDGFVLLTVAPDGWESEVPSLVERAHRRGLAALDPQWGDEGKLFPPDEAYG
jgi:hypothetical protein